MRVIPTTPETGGILQVNAKNSGKNMVIRPAGQKKPGSNWNVTKDPTTFMQKLQPHRETCWKDYKALLNS
jgi:hypothetical protein